MQQRLEDGVGASQDPKDTSNGGPSSTNDSGMDISRGAIRNASFSMDQDA